MYKIVKHKYPGKLEEMVTEMLALGWLPIGGVGNYFGEWAQAMIRADVNSVKLKIAKEAVNA